MVYGTVYICFGMFLSVGNCNLGDSEKNFYFLETYVWLDGNNNGLHELKILSTAILFEKGNKISKGNICYPVRLPIIMFKKRQPG